VSAGSSESLDPMFAYGKDLDIETFDECRGGLEEE
jgi:hypothetical protein